MLTKERYYVILKLLNERGAISVQELTSVLKSSESTVRRDLSNLHNEGKLNKVHGGATSLRGIYSSVEEPISIKQNLSTEEKKKIAKHAASFIKDGDLVFIDAGTTTGYIPEFITAKNITVVSCGVRNAQFCATCGIKTLLTGGELKSTTESLIGNATSADLRKYNFSIGFFGANGISVSQGYTTPDPEEAFIKSIAISKCQKAYAVADGSKFGVISSITFATLEELDIITAGQVDNRYFNETNVIEVG